MSGGAPSACPFLTLNVEWLNAPFYAGHTDSQIH